MNGFSRVSTATSGSEFMVQHGDPSSLAMLGRLYKKLEPQMTKSYRPHVEYIPPSVIFAEEQERLAKAENMQRRKAKLKAATMLLSNIGDGQRKSVTPGKVDTQSDMKKGASQSLPNLSNNES